MEPALLEPVEAGAELEAELVDMPPLVLEDDCEDEVDTESVAVDVDVADAVVILVKTVAEVEFEGIENREGARVERVEEKVGSIGLGAEKWLVEVDSPPDDEKVGSMGLGATKVLVLLVSCATATLMRPRRGAVRYWVVFMAL